MKELVFGCRLVQKIGTCLRLVWDMGPEKLKVE